MVLAQPVDGTVCYSVDNELGYDVCVRHKLPSGQDVTAHFAVSDPKDWPAAWPPRTGQTVRLFPPRVLRIGEADCVH